MSSLAFSRLVKASLGWRVSGRWRSEGYWEGKGEGKGEGEGGKGRRRDVLLGMAAKGDGRGGTLGHCLGGWCGWR